MPQRFDGTIGAQPHTVTLQNVRHESQNFMINRRPAAVIATICKEVVWLFLLCFLICVAVAQQIFPHQGGKSCPLFQNLFFQNHWKFLVLSLPIMSKVKRIREDGQLSKKQYESEVATSYSTPVFKLMSISKLFPPATIQSTFTKASQNALSTRRIVAVRKVDKKQEFSRLIFKIQM